MQSSPPLHTASEEAAATGVVGAGTMKNEQQIRGSASRGGCGGGGYRNRQNESWQSRRTRRYWRMLNCSVCCVASHV